jgi:ATP-dependent Clp protease ATP-binding subunit ClpC
MYERFTDRARKVMQFAKQEAMRFNHEYIGTEHILLGLVKEGAGVAANVLKNLDIDLRKIRLEVEKIVQAGPDMVTMGKLPQTPKAKRAIEYSIEEAHKLNHNYVGTEHLLLGLLREREGVAAQVLINLGLSPKVVREEVLNLLGHNIGPERGEIELTGEETARKTPLLDHYGLDLTELAQQGNLQPVIGRKNELERLALILSCPTQNNPLLVGGPGLGKSALGKGFALWLKELDRPQILGNQRIIGLTLAHLIARMSNSSRFEQVLIELLAEARQVKNIIFFLGDLPSLIGAGTAQLGDATRLLFKSALTSGEVRCIGTATPEGYATGMATDGTLTRLFRPVLLAPLSREETLAVLRERQALYEDRHRVRIAADALEAAVDLADLYWKDRCLPGNAVLLLDEACALVRFRNEPPFPALREMDERIDRLTLEKEESVACQDFDRAAHLRDEADRLKKRRDESERLYREQAGQVVGTVDKDAVADMVQKITGSPPQQ